MAEAKVTRERGGYMRTEEEAFPDFEELGGGEGAAGAEVGLEGGEGFFAGWTIWLGGVC